MKIAVVGGGINGVFSAWRLASIGHSVELYDAGGLMGGTSSASSKLLHGGIRYLEQGHLSLVRESLRDRAWWLQHAPHATRAIEITMPVYRRSQRGIWTLYVGAQLYRLLAGKFSLGGSKIMRMNKANPVNTELREQDLRGIVTYFDGQMNEQRLGLWVIENALKSGVKVFENVQVERVTRSGLIYLESDVARKYDCVINAAGPWAEELNKKSGIDTNFSLDLVRGSHLLIDYELEGSYLLQDPSSTRVVFVLDYFGNALIGTTEVLQSDGQIPSCSVEERDYLLSIYNTHFKHQINASDIIKEYSGLRPILRKRTSTQDRNFSRASREAEVEVLDRLITIYGGKWTSAPSLSEKVLKKLVEIKG